MIVDKAFSISNSNVTVGHKLIVIVYDLHDLAATLINIKKIWSIRVYSPLWSAIGKSMPYQYTNDGFDASTKHQPLTRHKRYRLPYNIVQKKLVVRLRYHSARIIFPKWNCREQAKRRFFPAASRLKTSHSSGHYTASLSGSFMVCGM